MAQPLPEEPPHYPVTQCTSVRCRAPIISATLPNGDRIPVDAEPVNTSRVKADILLAHAGPGKVRATRVTNPAQLFGRRWVYRSHFDTCADAPRYRRRR